MEKTDEVNGELPCIIQLQEVAAIWVGEDADGFQTPGTHMTMPNTVEPEVC